MAVSATVLTVGGAAALRALFPGLRRRRRQTTKLAGPGDLRHQRSAAGVDGGAADEERRTHWFQAVELAHQAAATRGEGSEVRAGVGSGTGGELPGEGRGGGLVRARLGATGGSPQPWHRRPSRYGLLHRPTPQSSPLCTAPECRQGWPPRSAPSYSYGTSSSSGWCGARARPRRLPPRSRGHVPRRRGRRLSPPDPFPLRRRGHTPHSFREGGLRTGMPPTRWMPLVTSCT